MKIKLHVFDNRLFEVIDPKENVEVLVKGLQASEGSIWDYRNHRLLFNDHVASNCWEWTKERGGRILYNNGTHEVGMCFDLDGKILACEHATSSVVRKDAEGTDVQVLFDHAEGHEFNAPNDIVVRSDGLVYFTDPDFGRMDCPVGVPRPRPYQDHCIWIGNPETGEVKRGDGGFLEPNGICFSPDEKLLYVNDTPVNKIWVYEVAADGTLSNKRSFGDTVKIDDDESGPDGLKVDEAGNVYSCGPAGIHIFLPDGTPLGVIVYGWTMNFCWGGDDGRDFFICCDNKIIRTRTKLRGQTHIQYEKGIIPKK